MFAVLAANSIYMLAANSMLVLNQTLSASQPTCGCGETVLQVCQRRWVRPLPRTVTVPRVSVRRYARAQGAAPLLRQKRPRRRPEGAAHRTRLVGGRRDRRIGATEARRICLSRREHRRDVQVGLWWVIWPPRSGERVPKPALTLHPTNSSRGRLGATTLPQTARVAAAARRAPPATRAPRGSRACSTAAPP